MNIYKPTWLYIKQHNITGLKYFGKTTVSDPIKYKGSGIYWLRHLKKHGNNVSTIWSQLFTDQQELIEYALNFSKKNMIVESKNWANLKEENGLDGTPPGTPAHNKGKKQAHKTHSPRKQGIAGSSSKLKGRKRPRSMCPHCFKDIDNVNFYRYHGDKCKKI